MFGFNGPFDFDGNGSTDPLEFALGIESLHVLEDDDNEDEDNDDSGTTGTTEN